jgi:fimbrial chaperone protein
MKVLSKWMSLCFASLFMLISGVTYAASSVLLWPINPALEADQSATSLWLENRGKDPVTLQIRVLAWTQSNFSDEYAAQKNIVASPPFARIEPGARQFVRLIRQGALPQRPEDVYRVLIDEVPNAPDANPSSQRVGVEFQMRYSLPLFVTAAGIWTQTRHDLERQPDTATKPVLTWSITNDRGERYLEVRNAGDVHARLSRVRWVGHGGDITMNDGLLGYVLAGQTMRWKLSSNMVPKSGMRLMVQLADNAPSIEIRAR